MLVEAVLFEQLIWAAVHFFVSEPAHINYSIAYIPHFFEQFVLLIFLLYLRKASAVFQLVQMFLNREKDVFPAELSKETPADRIFPANQTLLFLVFPKVQCYHLQAAPLPLLSLLKLHLIPFVLP